MPDILDPKVRLEIIEGITSEENYSRKREQQKRYDVYRDKQDPYILERLQREFDPNTVDNMRKIFSLNLTPRIINEMSSIYNVGPEREYGRADGVDVTDDEKMQLDNLYEALDVNVQMRRANVYYNLNDQCALMMVPDKKKGMKFRAIPPNHYDVVPYEDDPEEAYAYILNVWDKDTHKSTRNEDNEPTQLQRYRENDRRNQITADINDRYALQNKYVVWTKEYNFLMDGKGNILGEVMENPIGRLPFVDIAKEKDFNFFVERGSNVVDFSLDLATIWSDLANNIRMQGYSQAVITSEKAPSNFKVGPNNVLWLELNPNAPKDPNFEFVSPSPNIGDALEYIRDFVKMELSSRGIDVNTVITDSSGSGFTSGVDHILSMIESFEANRMDFDLFSKVEQDLLELIVVWNNVLQDSVDEGGEFVLPEVLRIASLPEDLFMDIQYHKPEMIQSKQDKEASVYGKLDRGLMSRKMAIMELDGVSEEIAEQTLAEIDEDNNMDDVNAGMEERIGEVSEGDQEEADGEQS